MRIEKRTDRGVAFGHPRSFVEQPGGIQEGRQLDLHALAAQRLELAYRIVEQSFRLAVAEELQILRTRHTETERRCAAEVEAVGLRRS